MRTGPAVLTALALVGGLLLAPTAGTVVAQDRPPADPGNPRVEAGVAPGAGVPDPRPGEAFADPAVADLQRTASEVQAELGDLAGRVRAAQDEVNSATAGLQRAKAERAEAEAAVAAQQQEVDKFSRSVFTAMGRPEEVRLLLTAASPKDLLDGSTMIEQLRRDQDDRLGQALRRHRAAVAAEQAATGVERTAAQRAAELERRQGDAANRADAISSELRAPIDAANAAVVAQQRAQRKRNSETAGNWKAYTDRLAEAGITPPPAAALRDPGSLPAGLDALPGKNGAPQAGAAQKTVDGTRLLVLPKETIEAVNTAVEALGRPFVPGRGGQGPAAYSCDGLVRSVFTGAGLDVPESAKEQFSRAAPVAAADAQPGDLVFVGPEKYGVQSVGIVLDKQTMLAADARLAGVVVADMPVGESLLGFARPALGSRPARPAPQRAEGELNWRCGGVQLPPRSGGGASAGQAVGAWGGYPNGLIPTAALCPIGIGSHVLRCDAAQAFQAMSQAFAGAFGRPLCVTDSYRTFDGQVDLYRRKPSLAAVPGTSNHGWGLALDMCGGVESFARPEHAWMAANAQAFGWVHPGWARAGGGREEPWHWEFTG
ncbi:D-alanyl-D-alanine carboxypeptidase family protein [Amycolatopsis palatopharyngis]|uniref:D-alanyl-D-alanine carboxypeptidase family protein n=1 Tax=Amycolatopsis palatopharyngis TaxID=187982 RepID=UPI000E23A962|nr:D-alanyl-D-alanine carboxypeptidase family protein [Amycolatopsis palatopharyngis]